MIPRELHSVLTFILIIATGAVIIDHISLTQQTNLHRAAEDIRPERTVHADHQITLAVAPTLLDSSGSAPIDLTVQVAHQSTRSGTTTQHHFTLSTTGLVVSDGQTGHLLLELGGRRITTDQDGYLLISGATLSHTGYQPPELTVSYHLLDLYQQRRIRYRLPTQTTILPDRSTPGRDLLIATDHQQRHLILSPYQVDTYQLIASLPSSYRAQQDGWCETAGSSSRTCVLNIILPAGIDRSSAHELTYDPGLVAQWMPLPTDTLARDRLRSSLFAGK